MSGEGDEFSELTGSSLRKLAEDAIKANKELTTKLSAYEAREVISKLGLTNVRPEDLSGVAASEMEAKAKEVDSARAAQANELITAGLKSRGYSDADIAKFLEGSTDNRQPSPSNDLSRLGGTAPGTGPPANMTPMQKIKWGMNNRGK